MNCEHPNTAPTPVDDSTDINPRKKIIIESLSNLEGSMHAIHSIEDVERIANSVMDDLPEATNLLHKIEIARTSRDRIAENTYVNQMRSLFKEIRDEIALIAGIETDEMTVRVENEEYRKKMAIDVNDLLERGDIDEGRALEVLGMLTPDKNGSLHFSYPIGMFPPHIDDKWNNYLDIVSQHMSALSQRQEGVSNDIGLIAQLDAVRRHAHNNLSLAIQEFLDLQGWDLDRCRKLVIKMRDSAYPTIETAEARVTENEILRLLSTVRLLGGRAIGQKEARDKQ